ncbi:MAG TPA: Ppx/GppA phosphatase family protein [Solirubrobacteraceae bacterium]|jgi:exopolyphosphatase/guanosine-5'-triphosphate,3'-diphosphate pyrophosphatase
MKPDERLAVIDLGSNSFRLVVFLAGDGWWKRTDEIYEPVRIGEGLAASGELGAEPTARALATLDVFAQFAKASGLTGDSVDAVATSAIRDATNADDFLHAARERFGLPIRVLSREEEARYGYLAAVNSTTLDDGFVLDLGGGSLQLVHVVERLARGSGSWRLGTVRMSERFLPPNGPAKRRQLEALREHVAEQLAEAEWLSGSDGVAQGRRLIGIGGTVRNLAAAAQRAAGLPSNGVQGMVIGREALDELVERLAELPAAERAAVPGIKPARADIILAGALVVQGVLQAGGFDGLETTEAGLREGVFFERLLASGTAGGLGVLGSSTPGEPLFADVRRASVLNLAGQYHLDVAHTRHVAALALGMFDELARLGLHEGDARERELLWAASILHDVGMSVDYDDHHKHSRYLILNAGLPGFTPVEVAIIAQAARYHRKGMPDPGPLRALFGEGDAARLDRCAVLLRLAEDLERSRDQLVRGTQIELHDNEVELRLIADGESIVPRWAARREKGLFARAFERELSVAA